MKISLLLLLTIFSCIAHGQEFQNTFQHVELLEALKQRDFNKKAAAIEEISEIKEESSRVLLIHLLEGQLYFVKKTGIVVSVVPSGKELVATSVLENELLGTFKKRKLKRISLNNNLRSLVRVKLAGFDLTHPDSDIRLKAVKNLMKNADADLVNLLSDALPDETDPEVRENLEIAIELGLLKSGSQEQQIQAIGVLEQNPSPVVRSQLAEILNETEDQTLQQRISLALKRIESAKSLYDFVKKLFFGLSLGSVLVLAAIGLAITFGVMGVINMAHGELIMLGAYTAFVMQQLLPQYPGVALILSIPMGFLVAGLVGVLIERGVIRHLYGRPLETLLATFGISLLLQQSVRTIFSPLNRSVVTPDWLSGSIMINDALTFTLNRLAILLFCLAVFAMLIVVLKRTHFGLQMRAVSQNRDMAKAMGIRSRRVDAMTFGLGSGIAGVAGVALSQLTNVGPNLGQSYIIDSFMVVVFGGVGNLWGTMIGGMTLGVLNKFLEPWSGAVLAKIIVLVLLILFIQKRPRGLFAEKGRAAAS